MPEPPFVVCLLDDTQRERRNLQAPERAWFALEHVQNHRPNDRRIRNDQDSAGAWRLRPSPPCHARYERIERLSPNRSSVWIASPGPETLGVVFGDVRD